MSAMMVDAAYDELYRAMKPGMSENEAVGLVSKVLYDMGSEYVEAVNAISGERCNPHPHVFSDRVLRPGDPVYYDILHSYMGYRTCYYRTLHASATRSHAMIDAYKRCRDYLDAAIELIRPGRTTAQVASVWPKAQEFGFPDEEAAFALQFGHGIGLAIWEKPVISRLVSLDHPHELKPGMVFALETFWPSTDGWSAARIEEEIVVTETGHEVITRFPAEKLLVAGAHYFTVNGPLPTTRETEALAKPARRRNGRSQREDGRSRSPRLRSCLRQSPIDYGRQRRHARARNGAGDRQAHLLAQEGRRARCQGRAAAGSGNRQGRRRSRVARRWHPLRGQGARRRRDSRGTERSRGCSLPARRRRWSRRRAQTGRRTDSATAGTSAASSGGLQCEVRRRQPKSGCRRRRGGWRGAWRGRRRRCAARAPAAKSWRKIFLMAAQGAGALAACQLALWLDSGKTAAGGPSEQLGTIGRLMAERTTQSWTSVPHFFVTREIDAGERWSTRISELAAEMEKSQRHQSHAHRLAVALVARTLAKHPRMNASWTADGIRHNPEINIGLGRWRWKRAWSRP